METFERERWTIADLIRVLQTYEDKTMLVVMSQDEEGNGFSPLSGFGIGRLAIPEKWGITQDLYEENETVVGSEPCLVLWPRG